MRVLALVLVAVFGLPLAAPLAHAQAIDVPAAPGVPAHTVYIFWGCGVRSGLRHDNRTKVEETLPNAPSEPIVDGRFYRQCNAHENFAFFSHEVFSPVPLAGPAIAAAIGLARNTPTGWGQDFPGYLQRFGSDYGSNAIRATTRYGLSSLLHEDVYYRICHRCSGSEKIKNALLDEFTARHGADGHRMISLTPIVSDYSGDLVAEAAWYPPGYGARDAAVRGTTSIPIHIGFNIVREFLFDRDTPCEKAARAGAPCKPAKP